MTDIKKFTSFATSNCYLVRPFNNEIVFLIDLPPNIDEVIAYINTNNLTVGGAFITHGHWDHAIGLSSFESKAYINIDDEHLARNPHEQIGDFLGDKVSVNKYEGNLHNVLDHEYDFLNVYINPGHTKGSVSFEFKDLGAVFTGDFIFKDSIGRTDLYSGDNNEMIDSINNVFTLFNDDFQLFPGHGDDDTVINIKNNNPFIREYLK